MLALPALCTTSVMLNRRSRFTPDQRSCHGRAGAPDRGLPVQPTKPWAGAMADGAGGGLAGTAPNEGTEPGRGLMRAGGDRARAGAATAPGLQGYRKRRDGAVRAVAASIGGARYSRSIQLTRRLRAMFWPWRDSPAWPSRVATRAARANVEIEEPLWDWLCRQFQSYFLTSK